jgi:hypothetical protein
VERDIISKTKFSKVVVSNDDIYPMLKAEQTYSLNFADIFVATILSKMIEFFQVL